MIDSSGKCAVGSPASDSEPHDKDNEKETERDKDNKDTAHGSVQVVCRLSAADKGHAATVAAATQSPYQRKSATSTMHDHMCRDHASARNGILAAVSLPEKFKFGVRDSGGKSPRGVFTWSTMVDHHP